MVGMGSVTDPKKLSGDDMAGDMDQRRCEAVPMGTFRTASLTNGRLPHVPRRMPPIGAPPHDLLIFDGLSTSGDHDTSLIQSNFSQASALHLPMNHGSYSRGVEVGPGNNLEPYLTLNTMHVPGTISGRSTSDSRKRTSSSLAVPSKRRKIDSEDPAMEGNKSGYTSPYSTNSGNQNPAHSSGAPQPPPPPPPAFAGRFVIEDPRHRDGIPGGQRRIAKPAAARLSSQRNQVSQSQIARQGYAIAPMPPGHQQPRSGYVLAQRYVEPPRQQQQEIPSGYPYSAENPYHDPILDIGPDIGGSTSAFPVYAGPTMQRYPYTPPFFPLSYNKQPEPEQHDKGVIGEQQDGEEGPKD